MDRRAFLTSTLGLAAARLVAACGGAAPAATSTPKPTDGADPPVPTVAPAGAATPHPDGTRPPAAPSGPTAAAAVGPAEARPTQGVPGTRPAPSPTVAQPVVQAVAALEKPRSEKRPSGRLLILQNQDFHPDHNAFVRLLLEEWGKAQGWPLEIAYVGLFQGGAELNQRLTAVVQAGTPPDILDHNGSIQQQVFLGLLEQISPFVQEMEAQHGKAVVGIRNAAQIEGKWYGAPYYTRAAGYYMRNDWFQGAGLDPDRDTETYDRMRQAALKISDPERKRWGWGMTVNRSGDGELMVQNLIHAFGGRTQDPTGEIVTLNSPETVAGLDWLKETYADPKWARMLPPGVNTWNDSSNNDAFLAGTIGITQNAGTMLAKAYFDRVPHADAIGQVQTPKSLNGQGPRLENGGGETLRLIKGTKNRDAALDTMRFWLSGPVQRTIWRISIAYALPAYDNGWSDPMVANHPISRKYRAVVDNEDWWGLATPGPIQAAVDAVAASFIFTDTMAEILKGKPTRQAVEEMHRRAVTLYKEFGLKGE